ncbi:MAG: PhoH family protein [Candidatus Omnitrophica bacterium]|nr:PhoH family protein [Candidatus Omnitrophota bacterium]MCG2703188.1 PhoH family protein [Candidatus Omnitrophota bacterium]
MPPKKTKVFVLDTNVILHDSSCIYQFKDNDIVIPIQVLEELDKFKKGNETLNFHAREFVRTLDTLSGDQIFDEGVRIATGRSRIIIKLGEAIHENLALNFSSNRTDHQILNIAYCLAQETPDKQIILVSKDVNLRMKAKAVGLIAEDYTSDHVKDISELYKGYRIVENASDSLINKMYLEPFEIDAEELNPTKEFFPNEYIILRNGKKSALARFNPETKKVHRVQKNAAYGIMPRNAEQIFALDALMDPKIQLVTLSGKAGTGKTLLALAGALANKKEYFQIYMARPVVPLSNKDIGFLPGDIQSKLEPYMLPLYDNLGVIKHKFLDSAVKQRQIQKLLDEEKLVISPLSYIRGRSLVDIFFIVDEAQNLTPHEVKTIITRAGDNTKLVFTGDIFQIDHPYLNTFSNGLTHLIDKMKGQKLYAHMNLEKGERSELAELASDIL